MNLIDQIKDFKEGQIYKMKVASRSHVIEPYYVEIIEVGKDFITTNIPDAHSLKIDEKNWDYHIPRMEFIGDKKEFGHLIYNQKLIHK